MSAIAPARASRRGLHDHSVRFYDQEQPLLDEVAEFLDEALRAGGLAIAIATADHLVELRRRLCGFGGRSDLVPAWFPGSLVLLDAQETLDRFLVDGRPDPLRFHSVMLPVLDQAPGGVLVHAFGEMVALLCGQGRYDAAVELEGLWNDLATERSLALFCAYPWSQFSSADHTQAFQHICKAHGSIRDLLSPKTKERSWHQVASGQQQARALLAEVERRKRAEATLRQRERELAEFLENASEGIHKVAEDGTILWANRAELEMLGYQWDEYAGHNIAEFYVDRELICDILGRLRRGETLRDQPAVLRCKDGSSKPVLLCSNGCFDNGKLLYTRCFTRDASERAEREALLQSLHEANSAKDAFLAMLGHELRNPLSPIVTALQLLRMKGSGEPPRELATIQRQVDHLAHLVDDLLDVSRITRGKIELKREMVKIDTVLQKAVEQASPLLEQRRHRLSVEVDPEIWCAVDPVRLAQVVANLLTNAARYTDAGGSVSLRAWRESEHLLAISVKDSGIGIAEDVLPQVFDLFFQGARCEDRSQGGLGIGLALVKSLVQLHAGTVHASSAGPGQGSEFIVRLPIVSSTASQTPSQAQRPWVAKAVKPRRILVVDDNADGADSLGLLLQAQGHDVAVFHDAASALAALPELRPEVAILDIGLPVMDGYELGEKIRGASGEGCALVAMTGYGLEVHKARSDAAGFRHHLVKPIDPAAIVRLVEESP